MGVVRVDRAFVFLEIWRNPNPIDWAFKMTPKMSLNMRCQSCCQSCCCQSFLQHGLLLPQRLLSELRLPEPLLL